MRNQSVAFIAIAIVVGCGGGEGSSKSTTPSADVARTEGGEAITTADGSAVSKVIIETALLNDDEKRRVCELAKRARFGQAWGLVYL